MRDTLGPIVELAIEVLEGVERPGGEERIAKVADGALDAPLLVAAGASDGPRSEVVVARELEKAGVEPDDVTDALEDNGFQIIVVLCPTRLRGRVRELCELNARSSRTRPHIRLECVEPGEQALVGPPDWFSREWRRSCGRRLARLQRRLLRAHVDLGVAVGRVQADVAEPTADHVASTPASSRCTAVVCRNTCGPTRPRRASRCRV